MPSQDQEFCPSSHMAATARFVACRCSGLCSGSCDLETNGRRGGVVMFGVDPKPGPAPALTG